MTGLDAFPRDEWPPVVRVRTAFQVMVGAGSAMALAAIAVIVAAASPARGWPDGRRWLLAFVALGPLGFVASRPAGWSPSGGASRGSCAG